MADQVRIGIYGDNHRLVRTLGDTERRMAALWQRTSGMAGRSVAFLGRSLRSPFAALVGGAAIIGAGKSIMDFDAALIRTAINGKLTADEQMKLRKEIEVTALATGQSRGAVLEGVGAIVEKIGDLEYARSIVKDMGVAATGSGAALSDIGAVASQLKSKLDIGAGGFMEAMDILNAQGKSGAFTLENFATEGERIFAAASRLGLKGADDLRRIGAYAQVARMATGSSEQATTVVERTISAIFDKQKEIKKLRFNIYDDTGKLKNFDTILKGIIVAAKGNEQVLGDIFGEQGIRGMSQMARMWRETGDFGTFDALRDVSAQGENMRDMSRYAGSFKYQLQTLTSVAEQFADSALAPLMSELSSSLRTLTSNPKKMEEFKDQIVGMGKNLGNMAADVYRLVEALTSLVPLLETVTGLVQVGANIIDLPFNLGKAGARETQRRAEYGAWENATPEERKSAYAANAQSLQAAYQQAVYSRVSTASAAGGPASQAPSANNVNLTVNVTGTQVTASGTSSGGASPSINVRRGLHLQPRRERH
jgi:TP901 family phage tail tape measure protein